jgi:glycosyltransferase involved in cell wall biosynthesis
MKEVSDCPLAVESGKSFTAESFSLLRLGMIPELSIIVPTYKRLATLERALLSISFGCSAAREVIVIDDCPAGSAASLAIRHGAKYYFKSGRRKGLSASRNLGIELAEGRALVFLDDDDFFVENGLDQLLSGLTRGGSIAVGNHSLLESGRLSPVDVSKVVYDDLLVCNRVPVGSYIIERSAIRRKFDETMRSHEDWDFLLHHFAETSWTYVPRCVVTIDKSENKTTSMAARRRMHFWSDFVSVYSRYSAPHLSSARRAMLRSLGLEISEDVFLQ